MIWYDMTYHWYDMMIWYDKWYDIWYKIIIIIIITIIIIIIIIKFFKFGFGIAQ